MVYYIDSRYGNDANDGLSRQTAFRSVEKMNEITLNGGDAVLLKAGTEYVGSLHLKRNRDGGIIKIDPLLPGVQNKLRSLPGGQISLHGRHGEGAKGQSGYR